jgi:uncharacterized protein (UPF0264 family)
LLTWYLESSKIKVDADFFKSQQYLKYEKEKRHREYELKQIALQSAISSFTPEVGQLVAIREWRDSPMRIGRIENVILPNKRQRFSIDVLEVKTDLNVGKRKINIWSKEKINAVIQSQKLQSGISKSDLINRIERNEHFEGLIWRMPQELWD